MLKAAITMQSELETQIILADTQTEGIKTFG